MSTPAAASLAPRQALSPIAMSPAGSPDSNGSVQASTRVLPRSAASPSSSSSPPASGVTQIITSKEWVLPPRPKPGRKPSVDTPASKRKAQNRAAQRAFRERRATRVQELEEKLMEVEKERDIKEMGLVNTINKLKVENSFLMKNLESIRQEVEALKENKSRQSYVASSPNNINTNSPASSSAYSVQQISPAPSAESPPSFLASKPQASGSSFSAINGSKSAKSPRKVSFDCGVCLKNDCLCESVGLKAPEETDADRKLAETLSSFKPMAAVSLSRKRSAPKDSPEPQEIDFTAKFSSSNTTSNTRPMPKLTKKRKSESSDTFNEDSPVENCGFCTDDTPCVCREAAKEAARLNDSLNHDHSEETKQLPPILNSNIFHSAPLPVMHPGPSVEIRDFTNLTPGAVPTVITKKQENEQDSSDGGCTGNPGTCSQCQLDPMSTLFCTTVASKASQNGPPSPAKSAATAPPMTNSPRPMVSRTNSKANVSSIGSSTAPSTPSSSAPPPLIATNNPATSTSGMFIPCADAYKTLSRHKKFNSVDFSTLVGKLTTRGMQVEVQSVANVLRELDRRVYN